MQIAICSRDEECCFRFREWLEYYVMTEKVKIRLFIYHDTEYLFRTVSHGKVWDLILIDMDLPDHTGIAVGKRIRCHPFAAMTELIFFSEGEDGCSKLFELEPLNWYRKPLCREKLYHDLAKIKAGNTGAEGILRYSEDGIICGIPLGEVVYIEALGKLLHVHTRGNDEIIERDSLNHMERKYRIYNFCRCHRSFLVNMDYVTDCRKHAFLLENNSEIPYGVKYLDQIRSAVKRWKNRR